LNGKSLLNIHHFVSVLVPFLCWIEPNPYYLKLLDATVKLEQFRAGPVETNIGASLVRFGVPDTRKATVNLLGSLTEEYAGPNALNDLCGIEQLDKGSLALTILTTLDNLH
jgi:hypothetical protein